jgi:hypothetical protein
MNILFLASRTRTTSLSHTHSSTPSCLHCMQLETNDITKKFPRNSSRIRAKRTASSSKVGSKRSCDCITSTLEMAREVHRMRSFDCIQRTSKTTREVHNTRSWFCITRTCKMTRNVCNERSWNSQTQKRERRNKRDCQTFSQRGGKQKKLTDRT